MRIKHRTVLRTKELRKMVKGFEETPLLIHQALRETQLGKVPVEHIVLDDKSELYFVQNELWFVQLEGAMFPGLPALIANNVQLPQVVVDMGAVPHIANGADVMAPGIVDADHNICEDDQVWISDEKHRKPLAIGIAIMNGEQMINEKQGKAIRTIHYVGDLLWNYVAKSL